MDYLDTSSLFKTVDQVSEALFFNLEISDNEKASIADFIVHQQGKPNAYANTFAPTEWDLNHDLRLFTGETIRTNAGRRHIIGEEASRILRLIGGQDEKVLTALNNADQGLLGRINSGKKDPRYIHGTYCCKTCSSALWLNVSAGGLQNDTSLLNSGLHYLYKLRDGMGSWKGFPSNYILYVLNEIAINEARIELKYASLAIEKKLNRKTNSETKYDLRKKEIYRRILHKINRN